MAQHDGVIANQGFSAFRSDLNDLAQAILSTHSGTAAPSGVVAGQFWIDTDTPSATVRTLFHYDGTDSIGIMQIDYTNNYIAKLGIGIVPSGMASGTMLHVKGVASGATADTGGDDFVLEGSMSIVNADATLGTLYFGSPSDSIGARVDWQYSTSTMRIGTSKSGGILRLDAGADTECARLDALKFFVGDSADTDVTQGATINQGASDNTILAFKSSDVAHGITGQSETDTYANLMKFDAAAGGVYQKTYTEGTVAHLMLAQQTTANSTHTTAGTAGFSVRTMVKSGTSVTDLTTQNSLTVIGSAGAAFIVGADGNLYADGTLAAYDDHDDTGLLIEHNALANVNRRDVAPPQEFFSRLWRMDRVGLAGYVGPRQWAKGVRPLDNITGLVRVLRGEAVQRAEREAIYVQAQEEMLPGFMARCVELAAGRNVGRLPAPIKLS